MDTPPQTPSPKIDSPQDCKKTTSSDTLYEEALWLTGC